MLSRIDSSGLLVAATFPVLLACGCVLAKGADYSQSALQCFREIALRSWVRVLLIGSAIPITLAVFGIATEVVNLDKIVQSQLPQNESGVTTLFLIALIVVCVLVMASMVIILRSYCFLWFFWTLCILPELPAVKALDQAVDGQKLNGFIVWPFTAGSVLLVFTLFFPVLFVPWLAITTSMMYVSYRDIWLMNPKNQPVNARMALVKA